MTIADNNWATHDFAVKMLDWSAARGSRLAYRCRRCGRNFQHFSLASRNVWAVDDQRRPLEDIVSNRWLSEACPRISGVRDDEDRRRLLKPTADRDA